MVNLNNVNTKGEGLSNIKRIVKGSVFSIVLTLILLLIFSAILTYTSAGENIMPGVIIGITIISILTGSIVSSIHIKKNGMLNGALVGLIYITFIYLLSSIITHNFGLNLYSIIMIIASILSGAIGGIIGVNKKLRKKFLNLLDICPKI